MIQLIKTVKEKIVEKDTTIAINADASYKGCPLKNHIKK